MKNISIVIILSMLVTGCMIGGASNKTMYHQYDLLYPKNPKFSISKQSIDDQYKNHLSSAYVYWTTYQIEPTTSIKSEGSKSFFVFWMDGRVFSSSSSAVLTAEYLSKLGGNAGYYEIDSKGRMVIEFYRWYPGSWEYRYSKVYGKLDGDILYLYRDASRQDVYSKFKRSALDGPVKKIEW